MSAQSDPRRPGGKKDDYLFKNVVMRAGKKLFERLFNRPVNRIDEVRVDEEQTLLSGRPDLVLDLYTDDEALLVQFEHQTADDPELGEKLARHFVAILKRFGKAPTQVVAFMDDSASKYASGVKFLTPTGTGMTLTFWAFNFSQIPAEWFLDDEDPFGLMLAMFCDRSRIGETTWLETVGRAVPKMS
ncbi:MAG: hypothetical protein RMM53_12395 [Bacteroidia bacterium]|nr:hypothetical protein [Bacteroidia bacterium]